MSHLPLRTFQVLLDRLCQLSDLQIATSAAKKIIFIFVRLNTVTRFGRAYTGKEEKQISSVMNNCFR